MIVEAYNIKYKQITKVWDISGAGAIDKFIAYQDTIRNGIVDDSLLSKDICPSVLQVKIPDCDPTEIEEIYAYTKSALENKTKQIVVSFNMRF